MTKRLLFCVLIVSTLSLASEPGAPLVYEDWVLDLPGLTVTPVAPYVEAGGPPWCEVSDLFCQYIGRDNIGADGSAYYLPPEDNASVVACEGPSSPCKRREVRRLTPNGQIELVAHVDERTSNPTNVIDVPGIIVIWVDPANGFLYVNTTPRCQDDNDGVLDCTYAGGKEVFRIEGLPTTFEILQTYSPDTSTIGFRVPYMPEGFQFADRFDTYYGQLSTVGDWSQAKPLQCGYPTTPPSVGDYLTVEDTLPPPSPGTGYYYVTSVTYQGQTRYGRKATDGKLSGRNPVLLPGCE